MDIKDTLVSEKRLSVGTVTRQLALAVLSAAVSIGELPLGVSPLGFAALGAVSGWDVIGVSIGVLAGLVRSETPLIMFGAYALTLLLRAVFSLIEGKNTRTFDEHLSLRAVAAATGAFAIGVYRLIVNDMLYYYLFGLIASVAVVTVATPLWHIIASRENEGRYVFFKYVSLISLASAVTWGVRGISAYGVVLSVLSCTVFTLLATRRYGASFGGVLGGISGLCVSVLYAPSFAFCGTVYGLLHSVSPLLSAVLSFLVAIGWGVYINGILAASSLLPALMSAIFIFYVIDRLYLSEIWAREGKTDVKFQAILAGDIALIRLDNTATGMKRLCQGFSRLSSVLEGRKRDTDTDEAMLEIGDLGADTRFEEYVGYINGVLRNDFPSVDYKRVAEYLSQVTEDTGTELSIDTERSEMLTEILISKYGREDVRAVAYGSSKPRIAVLCDGESFLRSRCEDVARILSDVCGYAVTYGEIRESDGRAYLTFRQIPILGVSVFGKKKNAYAEEVFCGDSFGVVDKSEEGRFFAFISDGMGSGREAAHTSDLCAAFLEELLPAGAAGGARIDTALEMLNGFLRNRNNFGVVECASTVDLCDLDLISCRASFYKCGAAPTYVFRDGSLFKLRCRTVPIGIVDGVDVGKVDMELLPGDVIVMVSDGVTQGREECPELFEYLHARLLTHNAEQLADAVVDFAVSQGSTDDISAVVIKVNEVIA